MILELEESYLDDNKDSLLTSLDSLLPANQDYFLSNDTVMGVDFLLFARVYTSILDQSVENSLKPKLLAWYSRMLKNEIVIAALKVISLFLTFKDLGKSTRAKGGCIVYRGPSRSNNASVLSF
jgi:hypothetical protein